MMRPDLSGRVPMIVVFAFVCLIGACSGDDDSGVDPDSGDNADITVDSGPDTAVDIGDDTASDTGADIGADASAPVVEGSEPMMMAETSAPEGEPSPQLPVLTESVTQEAGPDGATFEVDGLDVLIPRGALDEPLDITISRYEASLNPDIEPLSAVFSCDAPGVTFDPPLQATFTLDSDAPAQLLWVADDGEWEVLQGSQTGDQLTVELSHCSRGAAFGAAIDLLQIYATWEQASGGADGSSDYDYLKIPEQITITSCSQLVDYVMVNNVRTEWRAPTESPVYQTGDCCPVNTELVVGRSGERICMACPTGQTLGTAASGATGEVDGWLCYFTNQERSCGSPSRDLNATIFGTPICQEGSSCVITANGGRVCIFDDDVDACKYSNGDTGIAICGEDTFRCCARSSACTADRPCVCNEEAQACEPYAVDPCRQPYQRGNPCPVFQTRASSYITPAGTLQSECAPTGAEPYGVDDYSCSCPDGWNLEPLPGATTEDVAQGAFTCTQGPAADAACDPNPCPGGQTCIPIRDGYECTCPDGLRFDGESCRNSSACNESGDLTRCERVLGAPVQNASCVANPVASDATDTFDRPATLCECAAGYTAVLDQNGSAISCSDTDECLEGRCDALATCTNSNPGFTCECPEGYTGSGIGAGSCQDIDECITGACYPGATCVNEMGGVECTCPEGYTGDGLGPDGCEDIDECAVDNGGCVENATCVNTDGGRTCECPARWEGDGITGCVPTVCDVSPAGCPALDWVALNGGTYSMGATGGGSPAHDVTVGPFQIMRTEVTVQQYRMCVESGYCTPPPVGADRTWNVPGQENHPVNGVTWTQLTRFASWVGARLPTEAEWEYAARSEGELNTYPWGSDTPTCLLADHFATGPIHCNGTGPSEVCSTPMGNTAQGLCDMGGNLYEWVIDNWHPEYIGAPTDGSAWCDYPMCIDAASLHVVRGGAWNEQPVFLGTGMRNQNSNRHDGTNVGGRLVRN